LLFDGIEAWKMNNFDAAIKLAQKLGHVFVATADSSGMPHVAAAAQIQSASEDHVTVSAWFCPGTIANLDENRRISLVVWDPPLDKGYQLLGEVVNVEEQAMMNGYSAETEKHAPLPQVERKLVVRVAKILAFSHAPHSDVAE
jgi:uncharacterized protein